MGLEEALGKRLQAARQKAGLTQQELCQQANLSYSTLAKIERGAIKAPSIFTIQSIAGCLNSSLDELVGHVASPPPVAKKTSKSGIKFVYFDINGCLVQFFQQAFVDLASKTHASPDVVETTFWHYNDALCRGEFDMQEFNRLLGEKLGAQDVDWLQMYTAAVEPVASMHQLVEWAAQHYEIGLLSNIMPGALDMLIQKKLIPDVSYTTVVDSSEVGSIKPEQKIYEVAQGLTNCQPGEILLVDDSRTNLMAAEKMGWRVLWFDDFRTEDSTKKIRLALEF